MRAAQFEAKGGALVIRNISIPTPGLGEVRIRVHACGVCHSDVASKYNAYNIPDFYPHTPGHEAVGVVHALGEGVTSFQVGERVGVGWFGGSCHKCATCVKSNTWMGCTGAQYITSVTSQGGYADYMVAREDALARIPAGLSDEDASPLLCAGITTFNSLRNCKARAGDVVAIVGVGGLGHLGVQYAAKMGFTTVAVSRGADKKDLALKLGAKHYFDSTNVAEVVKGLKGLGGARVILDTAGNGQLLVDLIAALAYDGQIIVDAVVPEPVPIPLLALLNRRGSITAWASGDSRDCQDTLDFSQQTGVKPMNEVFSLEKAEEAFQRMLTTKAKFRVVLKLV